MNDDMNDDPISPRPGTLLLTGAAGALGQVLTPVLRSLCERLVLSDLAGPLAALGESDAVPCDLADAGAVRQLLRGVSAVVHLGGVSVEGPFEPILRANILGLHNLYEAARLAGTRRIVFASSNHVTGCYGQDHRVTPADPPRPDGNYGLSKLFGEGLAQLYFDRYGIETVSLRIGTATLQPPDRRGLSTWLSHADLARLVQAALLAPDVGALVVYGISANPARWYDSDAGWARIGYVPQDSAEPWRGQVEHIVAAPGSVMARLQGGSFLGVGPFDPVDATPRA
jgi:uronate dehydrogenase